VREDRHRRDEEDDRQERERPPLERLHQVVTEEGETRLQQHDHDERDQRADAEQRRERERAADAVGGEPAHAGGDGHQHRRHGVATEAEGHAAQHHLRHPVQWTARRQEVVRGGAESRADHDPSDCLPERHSEGEYREHADEDRRELEVR
jgi:hypothetical protein